MGDHVGGGGEAESKAQRQSRR